MAGTKKVCHEDVFELHYYLDPEADPPELCPCDSREEAESVACAFDGQVYMPVFGSLKLACIAGKICRQVPSFGANGANAWIELPLAED